MKKISLSFLCVLFLAMINCSEDETPITEVDAQENLDPETEEPEETIEQQEPELEVYFTLNIDSSYESAPVNSEQIQNWIIIHDLEGNLIDYQSFEPGQQVVFKELPEDTAEKLTITLFNHHFRINEYRHDFETFPNIDKNKEWFLNTYGLNVDGTSDSGDYSQTISDIPNPQGGMPYYSLSSDRNLVSPSASASSELGKSKLELENIMLNKDEEYLLIVQGILNQAFYRYAFIKPIENIGLPDLSFNDLTPVTLGAEFNFPPTSLKSFSVRGLTAEKSYNDLGFNLIDGSTLNEYPLGIWSNRLSVKIPIIETFDRFQTIVQMSLTGYKWYYVKQGQYPNNTAIPEKPVVTFVNQEINNFIIDTDLNYQRKISSWFVRNDNTDDSISTTLRKIHSTNDMYPLIGELPQEFYTLYPKMDIENITYLATDFYLRNESYSEFINNKFEANQDRWNQDLELEIITLFKE